MKVSLSILIILCAAYTISFGSGILNREGVSTSDGMYMMQTQGITTPTSDYIPEAPLPGDSDVYEEDGTTLAYEEDGTTWTEEG